MIRWLQTPGNADRELLGGKGANLSRLAAARLPVPAGFCLTTAAYRGFVAAHQLESAIDALVQELKNSDLAALYDTAERIQALFTEVALPETVFTALSEAYNTLTAQVGSPAVAVRSSASQEDLPGASFAGIYESVLNMQGEAQVAEGVVRCYASLWSPQAIRYRQERGLGQRHAQMAVVVQRMAPAEASGVTFTADPLSGDRERIVINAAWGLGQGIVQGDVGGDVYVLDKRTYEVLERQIGEKREEWIASTNGGLEQRPVAAPRQAIPCLGDDMAATVARLAVAAEQLLGEPQDVEWTAVSGMVQLLQSRPITALPQFDDFPVVWEREDDRNLSWALGTATEAGTPKAELPLEQSLGLVWWRAWNTGRTLSGARSATLARYLNGYLYTTTIPLSPEVGGSVERLRAFNERVDAWLDKGTILWETEVKPEVEANIAPLERFPLRETSDGALADHLTELIRVFERHWELHWQMGNRAASERFLRAVTEAIGPLGESALQRVRGVDGRIQGVPTKTRETVAGLRELARLAQRSPEITRLLQEKSSEAALASLPKVEMGHPFLENLHAFLDVYGHRAGSGFGSSATIATPTWWEEPSIALQLIAKYLEGDPEALEREELELLEKREAALNELLAAANEEQRPHLMQALSLAQAESKIMEDHNFLIEQRTGALVRYGFMEAARRWVESGILTETDDLYFLEAEEIAEGLREQPTPNLRPLVARRRADWQRWQTLKPPPYLGLPPKSPSSAPGEVEGTQLRGTPASAGMAVGTARVVDSSVLVPAIAPGEILVANNAGPMWTPVFPVIAGLVLDGGEIFQHAALVAREYGVPAVIKTGIATQIIRDGQRIAIDGSSGVVELAPESVETKSAQKND